MIVRKKGIASPYGPITKKNEANNHPNPITAKSVRKPGGKKRGSVWNYFMEDPTDFSFASCVICNKRITRGKAGEPIGKQNNSSMNNHLRSHKNEIEETPKEKNKDTESKVWEFFEKDDVNPESFLCQVHIITYSTLLVTSNKGLGLTTPPSQLMVVVTIECLAV